MGKELAFLTFFLTVFWVSLIAQQDSVIGRVYYEMGLDKAKKGELEEAVQLFDKSIAGKNDEYLAWYNRGIVKGMMGRYEDELADMDQSIRLMPAYKKAYLNRGTAKRHLTDYGGAISDFTLAAQLDTTYAEAFYNRGSVYELYGKFELACNDFNKADKLGFTRAEVKVQLCLNNMATEKTAHSILFLTSTAENIKYGFSSEYPVKVGTGPDGGLENERTYLDLLRDARGDPVHYQKVGNCCGYPSVNAPHGIAMVEKYEIGFTNVAGEQKIADVYLSFYDYDEPKILFGFKTVGNK